jgi:hypothetical protein
MFLELELKNEKINHIPRLELSKKEFSSLIGLAKESLKN